jgi:hypothetical protein
MLTVERELAIRKVLFGAPVNAATLPQLVVDTKALHS